MKWEVSTIKVMKDGVVLKTKFHDEFDALEWAEKNTVGKIKIVTERVIKI
jgi:hypothetical protein